jgi:hypothetical protein
VILFILTLTVLSSVDRETSRTACIRTKEDKSKINQKTKEIQIKLCFSCVTSSLLCVLLF